MHPFKHFHTITKHRNKVCSLCFKSGLYRQGLAHDLSKYSNAEFWNGAKYFQGTRSPHYAERLDKGYSDAWMHHKGRNKHHIEYWSDYNVEKKKYAPVDMPNRYLAESLCDRIAASMVYNGKKFERIMVLQYFYHETENLEMTDNTRTRLEYIIRYYVEYGNEVFKFVKKNMRNMNTDIPMDRPVCDKSKEEVVKYGNEASA